LLPGNISEEDSYEEMPSRVFNGPYPTNESENRILQKELTSILIKEIVKLPVLYQTLITLFHHESVSYEELSQITGLPVGTVKSYLFRARKMLKENLLSKYKKEAL
jgi:RNA polymerase sigma-70 factor (ECF subfamily)